MTERIRDMQAELDGVKLEHLEVPPQSALPQTRSIVIQLLAQWILRDAGYSPPPRDSDEPGQMATTATPGTPDNPH